MGRQEETAEQASQLLDGKLEGAGAETRRVVLRDIATSWRVQRSARREVPGRVPLGVLPADVAQAAGTSAIVSFSDKTADHLFEEKADRAVEDLDLLAELARARIALRTDPEGRRSLHALIEAPAAILPYAIDATLEIAAGPDRAFVMGEARRAIAAFAAETHRLGRLVSRTAIASALHRQGVRRVFVSRPVADIQPQPDAAPWCTGILVAGTA